MHKFSLLVLYQASLQDGYFGEHDNNMEIQIGNLTATSPNMGDDTLSVFIWGSSGCGKTVLASTMPRPILWILYDRGGARSITGQDDIAVLDFSGEEQQHILRWKSSDPMGIERYVKSEENVFRSVVFDSLTSFADLAVQNAVANVRSAEYENPGLKGYGFRNATMKRVVNVLLRMTKRNGLNVCFIAHEDTPDRDKDGNITQITTSLSDKQGNEYGLAVDEIWHMEDSSQGRRIQVRPARNFKPMKTRMFKASRTSLEFPVHDIDDPKFTGISDWWQTWVDNEMKAIPLPK